MAKRQLTERERAERLEFVRGEIIKRYGTGHGSVRQAAEGLKMNYGQFANILNGTLRPTEKLLQTLGYVDPDFVTPTGNKWTMGDIIEVEITENAKHLRNKMLNLMPHLDYRRQEAEFMSGAVSRLIELIYAQPERHLKFRELTEREAAQMENCNAINIDPASLAASGHESDMTGDNINSLFEGME